MNYVKKVYSSIFVDSLHVNNFFVSFIWFSNLSLFTLYMHQVLHFNYNEISFSLLVLTIFSRISRVFTSNLLTIVPHKILMIISYFGLVLGFISLSLTSNIILVNLALFIIGFAYGTINTIILVYVGESSKNSLVSFANLSVGVNLATSFGPLISAFIFNYYPRVMVLLYTFIAFFILLYLFFSRPLNFKIPKQEKMFKSFFILIKSEYIYIFVCTLCWLFYFQFNSFTQLAMLHLDAIRLNGILHTLNGVIVVFFSKYLMKKFNSLTTGNMLLIAFILYAICFMFSYLMPNKIGITLYIVFLSFSEIFFTSKLMSLISDSDNPSVKAMFFSLNAICMGVGDGLGNVLGVYLGKAFIYHNLHILFFMSILSIVVGLVFKYVSK